MTSNPSPLEAALANAVTPASTDVSASRTVNVNGTSVTYTEVTLDGLGD